MKEMYTDNRYKYSHKKNAKSFAKAPCKALDIKQQIGQNSQLHSFTAEGFLCPNKTIKQSQIFSHQNASGKMCPKHFLYTKP